MTRLTLVLLAACLAALALPAAASAMIQIDKGIAGARIDNTRAEVRAALGTPRRVIRGENDFGKYLEYRYAGRIRVLFQGRRRVTSVATSGKGDRTAAGVGVGSRRRAVVNRVPGVTCDTFEGVTSCHTGSGAPGQRITDFLIRNRRVFRVTVGIVID